MRRPPLFNSLLSFFTTFFEMRVAGSCYQPLNPYYFLFSAALLRPRYLPLPSSAALAAARCFLLRRFPPALIPLVGGALRCSFGW